MKKIITTFSLFISIYIILFLLYLIVFIFLTWVIKFLATSWFFLLSFPVFFLGIFIFSNKWLFYTLIIFFLLGLIYIFFAGRKKILEQKFCFWLSTSSLTLFLILIVISLNITFEKTELFSQLPRGFEAQFVTAVTKPNDLIGKWELAVRQNLEAPKYDFRTVAWSPQSDKLLYSLSNKTGCISEIQPKLVYQDKCREKWYIYNLTAKEVKRINFPKSFNNSIISLAGFSSDGNELYFQNKNLAFNISQDKWAEVNKENTSPPQDKIEEGLKIDFKINNPGQLCILDIDNQELCSQGPTTSVLLSPDKSLVAFVHCLGYYQPCDLVILRKN